MKTESKRIKRSLLPMNLQLFAGDPPADPDPTPPVPPVKVEFTPEQQAAVDALIKDRLARAQKKHDDEKTAEKAEAERKQREQNEEFKTLYETAQAELVRVQGEVKTAEISALKTTLLVKAGYSAEQIARVGKFVIGEDEAAIQASIDEVKADIPPKTPGVDPNPGNGPKPDPKPSDLAAEGKARFERLKKEGKIR